MYKVVNLIEVCFCVSSVLMYIRNTDTIFVITFNFCVTLMSDVVYLIHGLVILCT